jgi:hypothetical protein
VHFASIFVLSFANVNDPWVFGPKYLQFRLFCCFIEAQTKAALLTLSSLGNATHGGLFLSVLHHPLKSRQIQTIYVHFASIFALSFANVNDPWVFGPKYL